jgi:cyclophilin family peptidyl-prolyl cis-trans isomerase
MKKANRWLHHFPAAIFPSLAVFFSAMVHLHAAAPLGPEVVVLEISFAKEGSRFEFPSFKPKEYERVVIGLHDSIAPATVENFKKLARSRFYRGMRFHRAFPNSLVQTGDPRSRHGTMELSGTGGPGYTIPAEINLPVEKGSVAMARLPDHINPSRASSGSQFFFALEPMQNLNGQYTVFGTVLEGMEVLERISNTRTDSNDFPVEKIIIRRVRVEPREFAVQPG